MDERMLDWFEDLIEEEKAMPDPDENMISHYSDIIDEYSKEPSLYADCITQLKFSNKEVIALIYIYQCKACKGHFETDEQINCRREKCSRCIKCLYSLQEKFGCNGKISEEESNEAKSSI